MPAFVCRTCGVQHADTPTPPEICVICTDPRQYVGRDGQRWTTLDELARDGHRTVLRQLEPDLHGIGVEPSLGIGQRSLLVLTDAGNVLWDPTGFVDDAAVESVRRLGGLVAVSASHPHFHGVAVEWARAFGVPFLVPAVDARWVRRPDRCVQTYDDRVEVGSGVTLVRTGGHFPGSAVLHWATGADGRGALLTGDTVMVTQDPAWVSVMWSYPNLIPLDGPAIERIAAALSGLTYDRIYGGWWDRVVPEGAADAVARSLARYRTALTDAQALEPPAADPAGV